MKKTNELKSRAFMMACTLGMLTLGACGASEKTEETRARGSDTAGNEISLPETPSREEVQAELKIHASHIANCGMGGGEVVPVMITFDGASGSVSRIEYPEDEELARSVRICIESNLVNAAISPFLRERFTITYPFKLREEHKRPRARSADGESPLGEE